MNVVFLSPHFPPNYHLFCKNLKILGANVLGLADEAYDSLRPEVKSSLTEYYRVQNMHNYDELLRALGYFTHRYGKLDRLDSMNEYWLETEAQLRTDFNIYGIKLDSIATIKHKSLMKQTYQKAGVAVARGRVVHTIGEADQLIEDIGYPVVAKPDSGVGAAWTYKIHNEAELENFFAQKPAIDYIMEEFIQGDIISFDGLADRHGKLVFKTSHVFSRGIMETVNEDADIYYYSLRQIPTDLEDAGMRVVKAFRVRERFFHLEFFRRSTDHSLVALEVNMRPPGGLTTDMFNYANDIDIYYEWAHLLIYNRFTSSYSRKYHCGYIGRKRNHIYAHTHEEILGKYQSLIVEHEPMSGAFRGALGDYGYLVRSPDLEDILEAAKFIQETV